MNIPIHGKGVMVWQIRVWADAVCPRFQGIAAQVAAMVADAQARHLDWVCLKIVDGTLVKWEGSLAAQNADYLPLLVPALKAAGIQVNGWGWTYGRTRYSTHLDIAAAEASVTATQLRKYGMSSYLVDAESDYKRKGLGMAAIATKYASQLRSLVPDVALGLCSYRFDNQGAHGVDGSFPWLEFLEHMDFHAPQVYFIGAVTSSGAVDQLQRSSNDLQAIKRLPFIPIAPLYNASGWVPSPDQLTEFLVYAEDTLHCQAAGAWALDRAYYSHMGTQLTGFGDAIWASAEQTPAPPPASQAEVVTALVAWARGQGYTGPGLE